MSQPNTSSTRSTGSPLLRTLRCRAKLPMTAMLVASLTAWTLPANGASLVWVGGSGTWDNTIANWTPGPVAWVNGGDTAVFNTGAGTVTLGVPITAGGLTFNSSGYTIAGGTLTLVTAPGASAPVITTNRGVVATIGSVVSGTAGLVKTGPGSLLLTNSSNNYTGSISILDGSLCRHESCSAWHVWNSHHDWRKHRRELLGWLAGWHAGAPKWIGVRCGDEFYAGHWSSRP